MITHDGRRRAHDLGLAIDDGAARQDSGPAPAGGVIDGRGPNSCAVGALRHGAGHEADPAQEAST